MGGCPSSSFATVVKKKIKVAFTTRQLHFFHHPYHTHVRKTKNNLKKPSLASVGLKPRLSLSVISTHKALSLVLYCLPILDAQTTLAYSILPKSIHSI